MIRAGNSLVASLALLLALAPRAADARRVPPGPLQGTLTAAESLDLKLDPALRFVLGTPAGSAVQDAAASARRLAALARPESPLAVLFDRERAEPDVLAFVELDAAGSVGRLRDAGAEVMTLVEDIAVARIPVSRVRTVAALDEVRFVELSKRSEARLDSSRARAGVRSVHQGTGGLPQAYDGTGVVVGVLDGGIDYGHPDFRTPANTSRIKALYDYGTGPDGVECTPGSLDSLTCPERDGNGGHSHGTHVTGIAAGGGRRNAAYVGMAPGADIMFVKGIRDPQSAGGFTDADVVAGAQFIFQKARALSKPCVLNLSLGGQFGAHDGTSLYEQSLDHLTRPGSIIVAAAGNSGGSTIHCSYAVEGTNYATALETAWAVTPGSSTSFVDMWYPPSGAISVGLVAYANGDYDNPVFISQAAAPGQLLQGQATDGGTPIANCAIDARTVTDPNNGARRVLVVIQDVGPGVALEDYIWSVYTHGSGTFDMWVQSGVFAPIGQPLPPYFRGGDDARTIGIPATARRLIAVGSHVSKTQWIDFNGVARTQSNATLDAISWFSSRGPSRDGRVLPDFTAPGEVIVSSLSQNYPATADETLQGGGLLKQQGTSQASPHATGVIALMLQRDPALTSENARDLLRSTAVDAGAAGPDNVFGAGRMNALAALLATPDAVPCPAPAPNSGTPAEDCSEAPRFEGVALEVFPHPVARNAWFTFRLAAAEPVHLAVYDLLGRRIRVLRDGPTTAGPHTVAWDGTDDHGVRVPSGVYLTRALTPTRSDVRRTVVVR